jgi:mannose-6-phosphate isomerase-like protein (cupin superfamily)
MATAAFPLPRGGLGEGNSIPMSTGSVSVFLGGKVTRHSLPVFQGAPGSGAPNLKRLILSQGELAQFHDSAQGMQYLAFIELRLGAARGNHYHEKKQELVYIITGEVLLLVKDIEAGSRAEIPLKAGDLVLLQVRIAHVFNPLQPGAAIEFSPSRFDPADIFRYPIED